MFKEISKIINCNIYPVLSDSYSYIISKLSKDNAKLMFVSNDDNELELIAKQLKFFSPDKKVIIFPSWDCMPYDRISPNITNLNYRIKSLNELLNSDDAILLVSLSSMIQFLPPKELFKNYSRVIKINQTIKREEFLSFLTQLSFRRVEVASEVGDFAVRGDIIDIVTDNEKGWRLDFFGDKLERIREFELTTQISNLHIQQINILPSSEVILNLETIDSFCKNFRKNFGIVGVENPIYQAIELGRRYSGMEHYLPYFYENLSSIFDYFSPDQIIFNCGWENSLQSKFEEISNHYHKRQELLVSHFKDEVVYHPIESNLLWFDESSFYSKIENYKKVYCHNFNVDISKAIDLSIQKVDNFDLLSRSKSISAFDLLKQFRDKNKKRIIICCNSEGSLQRIKNILDNYNIHCYQLTNFADYKNISGKSIGITILPIEHGYCVEDFVIVSEQDLLGEKIIRKKSNKDLGQLLDEINNLQIDEYVVHQQHGIGLFLGLETLQLMELVMIA